MLNSKTRFFKGAGKKHNMERYRNIKAQLTVDDDTHQFLNYSIKHFKTINCISSYSSIIFPPYFIFRGTYLIITATCRPFSLFSPCLSLLKQFFLFPAQCRKMEVMGLSNLSCHFSKTLQKQHLNLRLSDYWDALTYSFFFFQGLFQTQYFSVI